MSQRSSPALPGLFAERTARLRKLLDMDVPDTMIATEATLVAVAWEGGPWRFLLAQLGRTAVAWWSWYASFPAGRLACRLGIRHDDDGDGFGCLYCDKGADPAMLAALEEDQE